MLSALSTTPPSSNPPRNLAPGQQVFSRYELQRILGRGGMGVVWLARDVQLDRDVALKFVADPYFRDAAARDDLRRETKRSLELTHPNIIRTYDYLEDSEMAAISLEYIDGLTLSQLRIQRPSATFDAEDLVEIVRDCCEALEYAHHDAGVVHRDLKPSNIMVTARGVAKIADFGISCGLQNTAARISAWNASGGTIGYMSPQQLRGDWASPADDVYAFGATLYELLTGRPPFHTGDLSYQIREIAAEPVDRRRAKHGVEGRPIPEAWVETIGACLAKDSAQRPATMHEVSERLGVGNRISARYRLDPDSTVASSREEPRPARKGSIRRTALIAAGVVLGVLSVAAGMVAVLLPAKRATEKAAKKAPVAMAAAARPEDASTGGLIVESNPPGAAVFMGKDRKGTTPCTIAGVRAGTHEVHVMMEGYEPAILTTAIRAGESAELGLVTLQRINGFLLVESDPQGCTFAVLPMNSDTEIRRGRTPDKIVGLPTGRYRVRMERPGWPTSEVETDVSGTGTQTVSRRFGQGSIVVATDPPGAELRLAGKLLGPTPRQETFPSGKHGPFAVQLKGFQPAQFEVHVLPGEVTKIPVISLVPEPPSLAVVSTPPGVRFKLYAGGAAPASSKPIVEGITPDHFLDLPAGAYHVVFHSPPWPEVSRGVRVEARGLTEVEQVFMAGTIAVSSEPAGATVLLGGKAVGTTPFERELPAGKYEVAANYKGRLARTRTVNLADEDSETIRFDFTAGTSSGSSTSTKSKTRRRTVQNEPYIKKVGRSISNFFTMDPKKKR
jgi:hypothetical protein